MSMLTRQDGWIDESIEIIPAIKRLKLKHIGCWDDLCMEFIPGLNIITDADSGSGKSTILRSILTAAHPSIRIAYPVAPTRGSSEGDILLKYMSQNISIRVLNSPRPPLARSTNESQGQFNLTLLSASIVVAPLGSAVMVEGDIVGRMDKSTYAEAVRLLTTAPCQIICIIGHRDLCQFRSARIYTCYWDQENDKVGIRLGQSGIM